MSTPPIIETRGLTLNTRSGPVYGPIDLIVPKGSLTLVTGPARSGKTAFLLTLAGRMVPSAGELHVAGFGGKERAAIRRAVGIGEFHGVNEFEDVLTVGDQLRMELALHKRRRSTDLSALLEPFGLQLDPHARMWSLTTPERTLLGAALGLLGQPLILVMDELDEGTTLEERSRVFTALHRLTLTGTTVVAGALDATLVPQADVTLAMDNNSLPNHDEVLCALL